MTTTKNSDITNGGRIPPTIRRVVTGHRPDGLAVVEREDEIQRLDLTAEHATFAVMWSTNEATSDNLDPRDGALKPVFSGSSHNQNGGSVLRIVDFPPGIQSPMHRTQSIDYGLVMWGEIEVELDSGEKRTLKTSDVCIQRGTNHLWRNNSKDWCRVAYVLLDAKPVVIEGRRLADEGYPDGAKQ